MIYQINFIVDKGRRFERPMWVNVKLFLGRDSWLIVTAGLTKLQVLSYQTAAHWVLYLKKQPPTGCYISKKTPKWV